MRAARGEASHELIMALSDAHRRGPICFSADTGAGKNFNLAIINASQILSLSNGKEAGDQNEKSKDEDGFHE